MLSLLRTRHAPFALFAAAALALAAPAQAQTTDEIKAARQTAGEGLAAYNASEFEKALALFEEARAVYPSAQVLRMVGYSELALERWVRAIEAMEASMASTIAPLSKADRKDVQDQIAKAMAHVGTAKVTTKVASAKLSVDGGEPRALPLDKPLRLGEGRHKLVVSAPEHLDATVELKVEAGKPSEVAIEPKLKPKPKPVERPPPPPPPPTRKEWFPQQRNVGFGLIGGGAAFGVATLVTGIQALRWHNIVADNQSTHLQDYGDRCSKGDPTLCGYEIEVINREADRANQLRAATIGLGVTASVLTAAGVVFAAAAPKKPASPTVACALSLGLGVQCSGAF